MLYICINRYIVNNTVNYFSWKKDILRMLTEKFVHFVMYIPAVSSTYIPGTTGMLCGQCVQHNPGVGPVH